MPQQLCIFDVQPLLNRYHGVFITAEDKLLFARHDTRASKETNYATATDFCDLFKKEMGRYYLLALMLTGDANAAEKCFAAAVESSQSGGVFSEWAHRWATHNIIKEAIRIVAPAQDTQPPERKAVRWNASPQQTMATLLGSLPALARFIYVMSVLEKYSDRECASFLGCALSEIRPARDRAVRQLGKMAEQLDGECKLRASA